MSINFNNAPYFDDYDEEKKFQKILFRPRFAVQTRELNQLQSQYQKQLERFGQGIYSEGAMVIPGGVSLNKTIGHVKMSGDVSNVVVTSGSEVSSVVSNDLESIFQSLIGKRVVGQSSGVEGILKYYQISTQTTPLTLFVEYDTSDTDEENDTVSTQVFTESEVLEIIDEETDENNYTSYQITTATTEATGDASLAEIERGVYFVRGFFALVDKQTIILDAYSNEPSYRVGLQILESVVTPEEDPSLNDNANGSFNFSAPGAHRYKIELILQKLSIGETNDEDFIELLQTQEGERQTHVQNTEYSEIAKEFARRTYDESGDYSVSAFRMFAKEARDNNRGQWTSGQAYLIGDIVESGGLYYVAANSGNAGGSAPSHIFGDVTDGSITWTYEETPQFNNGHNINGSEDKLVVSIDSGKAYVRGYEIEKPASSFVTINKAREFRQINDDLVPTTIGSYVLTRNFVGVPDFVLFTQVTLKNGSDETVGTARIRGLERDGANYRLYLFDIDLNEGISFDRSVKVVSNASFSCETFNIVPNDGQGSISISNAAVTGNGTRFTRDFIAGDTIDVSGSYYTIDEVTSDTALTLAQAASSATNVAYKIHRAIISDPARSVSIFPLSRSFIKSVKDETPSVAIPEMSYTVMQKVTATTDGSATSLTISLSEVSGLTGVGARIDPNTEIQEVIVSSANSQFITPTSFIVSADDQSFTITGLTPSTTYTVFFPAIKNSSVTVTPKTKTPVRYEFIDVTTSADIEQRIISLQKADVYRLRKVLMAPTTGAFTEAGAVDVTSYFELDDGQRDTHYDVASITRKPNFGAPTGSLRIYFDYFQHSSTGDYFCIDSYQTVRREDIPLYSSIYGIIYLADALDFRPRMADDGSGFTGVGSALALPPKPGTTTEADYTYYTPRIDKISLDVEGKFLVTEGTSADNATAPENPDLTMHMATLMLAPYTLNPYYVELQRIDNRRYTMRDIGKIEKRLENLEYYTSLSLLEQQASSLDVPDEFGLDRFKNGFIVDNFAGHTTGDVGSPDYKASIDMEMKELRPTFVMNNVNLLEQARTDSERSSQGYQLTGDIITLPYTEKSFISQEYASRPENINPFAIFTFIGSIELNPPSDEWIETQRIPEVINDIEGNFSSVLASEQAAGTLGTVWNAWQTQWTGTVVTGTRMVRAADWSTTDFGLGRGVWRPRSSFTAAERAFINNRPGARVLTYEVVANQSGQTRTGINTEVRATFSKEFVNDRVVSTSVIPYIRSRKVVFLARGLKLQTIVYPFFDQVNVSQYVTPAARLTFKGLNPNDVEDIDLFDFETNVGQDNDEPARRFKGNTQTSYNKGDVVYVKQRGLTTYSSPLTSPSTAVCVLQEVQPGGTTRSVLVVNTTGTFLPGDIIAGSVSGAEGEVTNWAPTQQGDKLVANFGGDVAGVFEIPNSDAIKFQTGNREFKLIDNLENSDLIAKTRGFGDYHAEGVLQTWQATYNSVRNAEVVRTVVTNERTVVTDERAGRLIRDTGWYDPLAQTFLVQNRGGAFITSVDIWLASVDPVKPITMQIREVVNGYPGKNILPFSNVTLYPYELRDENQPPGYGLSANRVEVEGGVWLAPDKPTKFTMKAPIFVQDVGEYCIVLLSNSNNYHAWTSELGGIDVTGPTPRLISEQPYAGVLFKSQNASTWTAHQNEDLMFRVNVAEFQTAGSAMFVNSRVDQVTLDNDPFFTRLGSSLVRVFQRNHGLAVGSRVTISNVLGGTYNNISSTQFNSTHDVVHVEHDAFVIKVESAAGRTGRTGGSNIRCTRNVQFDTVQPIIQLQNFADTALNFSVKTISGASINSSQTAGVQDSSFVPVIANDNNEFNLPRMIASPENESKYLNGQKSFYLRANMSTDNSSLSPVIDTARTSLIAVNNRINNATYLNNNYVGSNEDGDFDVYEIISLSDAIGFSGSRITTANTGIQAIFKSLRIGKYINISGSANNNGDHLILAISEDGSEVRTSSTFTNESAGNNITIKIYDNYIDEVAFEGTASAKYMTRKVNLSGSAADSTNLNIRFAAEIPIGALVDVYYKVAQTSATTRFERVLWKKAGTANSNGKLSDLSFDVENLDEFNVASVKLVMRSNNSSAIPRVKDLIVIATA
jgi:hypothetical protein